MKKTMAFILVIFCSAALFGGDFKIEYNGLRLYWLGFIPSGGNGIFTYNDAFFGDSESSFQLRAGGGLESFTAYRESDGTPVFSATGDDIDTLYTLDDLNFQWDLGVLQDIVSISDAPLRGFVYYRGRFDSKLDNDNSTSTVWYRNSGSIFSDRETLLQTSFIGGLSYDALEKKGTAVSGLAAEFSGEWAPYGLNPEASGGADFYRLNFQIRGFYPLLQENDEEGNQELALYTGGFFSADVAGGASIPLYVSGTFGGRELRKGLGSSVRGFESSSYDALNKFVLNWDLRLDFPTLWGLVTPGVLVFADAGYYANFFGGSTANGLLASAGVGVHANLFNFANLGVRFEIPLYGSRVDANWWHLHIMLGGFHF